MSNFGENVDTIKINCDFSKGTGLSRQVSGTRFFLPVSVFVEGYLKSVNTARIWCSCSSSTTTPMENFEKLEWDLSEVTNFSRIFEYWSNLKVLPDSITSEVLNKASNVDYAFKDCSSIQSIGVLEGANLDFSGISGCLLMFKNFGDKAYSATLGNFTFNVSNNQEGVPVFSNSFFSKIGDVHVTCKYSSTQYFVAGGLFADMTNLESIGNILVDGYDTFNFSKILYNTTKLKSVGSLIINFENIVKGTLSFDNAFHYCALSDYSFIQIPILDDIVSISFSYAFSSSNLLSIDNVPNYYELIRKASDTSRMFERTQITNVPDLDFDLCHSSNAMFYGCASLESVGSLVYKKSCSVTSMFDSCTSLRTITKFDCPLITKIQWTFRNAPSITTIDYFDITNYFIGDVTGEATFSSSSSLTKIIFVGQTSYKISNIIGFKSLNLSLESIQSFVDCLVTSEDAWTLTLSAYTYALLTEDLIALAASKNCTLASA